MNNCKEKVDFESRDENRWIKNWSNKILEWEVLLNLRNLMIK